jgi:hypothetical protein
MLEPGNIDLFDSSVFPRCWKHDAATPPTPKDSALPSGSPSNLHAMQAGLANWLNLRAVDVPSAPNGVMNEPEGGAEL